MVDQSKKLQQLQAWIGYFTVGSKGQDIWFRERLQVFTRGSALPFPSDNIANGLIFGIKVKRAERPSL